MGVTVQEAFDGACLVPPAGQGAGRPAHGPFPRAAFLSSLQGLSAGLDEALSMSEVRDLIEESQGEEEWKSAFVRFFLDVPEDMSVEELRDELTGVRA